MKQACRYIISNNEATCVQAPPKNTAHRKALLYQPGFLNIYSPSFKQMKHTSEKKNQVCLLSISQYSLVLEHLQSTDQPFQTQQVIAVGRHIDLVQDYIRCSRCLGVALLFTDYVLLRGLWLSESHVCCHMSRFKVKVSIFTMQKVIGARIYRSTWYTKGTSQWSDKSTSNTLSF